VLFTAARKMSLRWTRIVVHLSRRWNIPGLLRVISVDITLTYLSFFEGQHRFFESDCARDVSLDYRTQDLRLARPRLYTGISAVNGLTAQRERLSEIYR